jgi:hypothetical protein
MDALKGYASEGTEEHWPSLSSSSSNSEGDDAYIRPATGTPNHVLSDAECRARTIEWSSLIQPSQPRCRVDPTPPIPQRSKKRTRFLPNPAGSPEAVIPQSEHVDQRTLPPRENHSSASAPHNSEPTPVHHSERLFTRSVRADIPPGAAPQAPFFQPHALPPAALGPPGTVPYTVNNYYFYGGMHNTHFAGFNAIPSTPFVVNQPSNRIFRAPSHPASESSNVLNTAATTPTTAQATLHTTPIQQILDAQSLRRPQDNAHRTGPSQSVAAQNTDENTRSGDFNATNSIAPPSSQTDWDPFPNGNFERDFTWDEFARTGELMVHWACEPVGAPKKGKGSALAERWQDGRRTRRKCHGIIECNGCKRLVRPQTRLAQVTKQASQRCKCGNTLTHKRCGVVSELWKYKHGVHYINGGYHNHERPARTLHVTTDEQEQFTSLVSEHPDVKPLALLVGIPTLHGPGRSASNISSVYLNKDRIRADRRMLKAARPQGGDAFIQQFQQFEEENPQHVLLSQIGAQTVISIQTPFMREQLINIDVDEPINGLVTDAAHDFWLNKNALLIISSTYCFELQCWVPGLVSYSNGASAEHYELHFFALMKGLASEAKERNYLVNDDLFRTVC